MANFPYTTVSGRIKPLFQKIVQVGKPNNVDKNWLKGIGFVASNDPTLLTIIEDLGFTKSGQPTDLWQRYRDKSQSKNVMAEAVRNTYADLFGTYPDAHQRSDAELKNFFQSKSSAAGRTVDLMVTAFKNLRDLADFNEQSRTSAVESQAKIDITPVVERNGMAPSVINGSGVTVNVNIQLTVPETTDAAVYDSFFAALKKNLLS